MNWTAFPFFRGALAMALLLIPGVSFMTGCMVDTNLAGGDGTGGSTGGTGVGGMGGSGGGMGGSGGGMGGSEDPCLFFACDDAGIDATGFLGEAGAGGLALWSKRFGSPNIDMAGGTAVDSAGNVVVNLVVQTSPADFGGGLLPPCGGFVVKFDSSGNHVWSKCFGPPAEVAIDGAGNVVMSGRFEVMVDAGGGPLVSAGLSDIALVKLDSSGNHLWSKRFGGTGYDFGNVAIDSAGNMVVAGSFEGTIDFGGGPLTSAGLSDIYVAKFDPNGNHVWSKRFGGLGDEYSSAAIDSAGNVVITGNFYATVDFGGGPLTGAGSWDIYVAKFDPNGNHVWSKRFGDAEGQHVWARAIDSADNVAIAGKMWGTVDLGGGPLTGAGGIYVAKFDPNGNHVWSKRFGDDGGGGEADAMAIDSAGNVVITGLMNGTVDFGGSPLTGAADDMFVAKLDPTGNHLWSTHFGDASFHWAMGTAIDSTGNVVITGNFEGTADFGNGPHVSAGFYDVFLVKLKP